MFTQFFNSATTLNKSAFVFNARVEADRERLIDLIWSGEYREALEAQEYFNPHAAGLLDSLTSNMYVPKPAHLVAAQRKHSNLFAGIFSVITRTQSQDSITLLPVLLALQAYSMKVPGRFLETLACFFRGGLMSDSWIEPFIADAVKRDPGAHYVALDGVGLTAFDNCTIQVGYKSYAADGIVGFRMDMTNWATIAIPRTLFGLRYDLATVWSQGIYPHTLSRGEFARKFALANRAIQANKFARFARFLRETAAGSLFDRPDYTSSWKADVQPMPPIFDCLQGSYEHVETELDAFVAYYRARATPVYVLFVGGDGLSYDRVAHLVANDEAKYFQAKPAILPVLGLSPHGEYHIMHAGYRNFRPLIQAFAVVLNNKQLTFDPLVSEYNKVRYGLYVIMRACGEYLHELAETEGAVPYAMAAEFIEAGDRNIDLAWVMHLLYDFLYMWWDFKQAVRSNSSKHIDLLWAEFVPYGRTTVANKTHYGVMATLQVYQGIALHPALSQLYHQIRTVYTGGGPGTNVGLDMIIERINAGLKHDVTHQISREQVIRRLADHRLHEVVNRGIDAAVFDMRKKARAVEKDMEKDVNKLKEYLRTKVGKNWRQATRHKHDSDLIDHARAHLRPPWVKMVDSHLRGSGGGDKSLSEYVLEHVERLTPWQRWAQ